MDYFVTLLNAFSAAAVAETYVLRQPCSKFSVMVKGQAAAATAWSLDLQGSIDGANWQQLINHATADVDGVTKFVTDRPVTHIRLNLASVTLGTATNLIVAALAMP